MARIVNGTNKVAANICLDQARIRAGQHGLTIGALARHSGKGATQITTGVIDVAPA